MPAELGCGCGKTCRHYLRRWHQTGVWERLHALLLAELNEADRIDWERALIDASLIKAAEGGEDTGPNPTDRGKSGGEHHVMTDAQGIPLATTTTAPNVNEVTEALRALTRMPPVGGKPGPQRQRPNRLQGDRGVRLRAFAEGVPLAGDHPGPGRPVHRARQRLGNVPLVCGATDLLTASIWPIAPVLGSVDRNSGCVPSPRLCSHLFEIRESLTFIVSECS